MIPARGLLQFSAGALLVLGGYGVVRAPELAVSQGVLPIFSGGARPQVLMFVAAGCSASESALRDYELDPRLRRTVLPVPVAPPHTAFSDRVCAAAITGLREQGSWWVDLVDRETACEAAALEGAKLAETYRIVAFPQFVIDGKTAGVFEEDALRRHGVGTDRSSGELHYVGMD